MTDTGFQAAGFAVSPEDDSHQNFTPTHKTYAPVTYGSETVALSRREMSVYATEVWAINMAGK